MLNTSADLGTRAALREHLQLIEQQRRAEEETLRLAERRAALIGGGGEQARDASGRFVSGGAVAFDSQMNQEAFDRRVDRSLGRFRARASESPGMSARAAKMGVHGLEMLAEGAISPRSLAHGAEFLSEGAGGLGLGKVAAGAGTIAGLAGSAIGVVGLAAAGEAIVEKIWLEELRKREARAAEESAALRAAFVRSHAGELRGTVDIGEWMQREGLNRFSRERLREARHASEAEQERIRAEQLGIAGTERLINELMKGRLERDPFIRRQIAEEEAAKLLNAEEYALRHQNQFRRRLEARRPGAWEQGLGPGNDVPLTKAEMIEWMERNGLGEGLVGRQRHIAREAALEVFAGLAKELRESQERAFQAREARERAGEQLTGGIRNKVLWQQDRAKLLTYEQQELERYMSWADR